jgi:hypothetical protein
VTISNLPDYVERGSEQVWRMPSTASDIELYGFIVPADSQAIDALLDHDLNQPSGGAVDYRCGHRSVIVTMGRIGHEASADPIDSQRGYVTENEVSIWCLAADANSGGRLVWYLPYIFTDSQQTVSTGREVYGYPKQLGVYDPAFPATLGDAGGVTTVSGLAIDPYAPTTLAIQREMISVAHKPGAATLFGAPSLMGQLDSFFGGVSVNASLPSGPGSAPKLVITPSGSPPPAAAPPPATWVKGILNAIGGKAVAPDVNGLVVDMVNNTTLVFLKQFRDVGCTTKACYQAVIEAPLTFHLGGASYESLDPDSFSVTVQSWASDPIAAQLGIPAATPLTPTSAFRATLGFELGLGLEVWRAPT